MIDREEYQERREQFGSEQEWDEIHEEMRRAVDGLHAQGVNRFAAPLLAAAWKAEHDAWRKQDGFHETINIDVLPKEFKHRDLDSGVVTLHPAISNVLDHYVIWYHKKSKRMAVLISQPYDLTMLDLHELTKCCLENGLTFSLSGTSWHAPNATMMLRITTR